MVAIEGYDNPVWPETDGLEEVRRGGLARHAKWWQGPEGCEGKVSRRPFQDGDLSAHIFIVRGSSLLEMQVVMYIYRLVHLERHIKRIARCSTFNIQRSTLIDCYPSPKHLQCCKRHI